MMSAPNRGGPTRRAVSVLLALFEGPQEVAELARVSGVDVTTTRRDIQALRGAGVDIQRHTPARGLVSLSPDFLARIQG
jgi:predicted DNA-binding transcriptional regulator YafY